MRLRVNRREVEELAAGVPLKETIEFPGDTQFSYILEGSNYSTPGASFDENVIRVSVPQNEITNWSVGESIGIYFNLPANRTNLRVAIEKDLECVDGAADEHDPLAFPRNIGKNC